MSWSSPSALCHRGTGHMSLLLKAITGPVSHCPLKNHHLSQGLISLEKELGKRLNFHPAALGYLYERGANYQQLVRAQNYY